MTFMQRLLLSAIKNEEFLREFLKAILTPNVLELDPDKNYIITLDSPIDEASEKIFKEILSSNVMLITGAKAQIIEIDMEKK